MPNIIEITDFNDSALDVYVRLTGSQLRNKLEPEKGIFIAESPTVIEVAMNAGCVPVSFLTDERLIKSGAVEDIISKLPENIPIYVKGKSCRCRMSTAFNGNIVAFRNFCFDLFFNFGICGIENFINKIRFFRNFYSFALCSHIFISLPKSTLS